MATPENSIFLENLLALGTDLILNPTVRVRKGGGSKPTAHGGIK